MFDVTVFKKILNKYSKFPIALQIAVSFASLASIGSMYIFGLTNGLGYAFSNIIDGTLTAGAIQIVILFATFSFVYYKILAISGRIWSTSRYGSPDLAKFDSHVKDWEFVTWKPTVYPNNMRGRIRRIVKKIQLPLLFISLIIIIILSTMFVFRSFIDPGSVIFFYIKWSFWLLFILIPIVATRPHDEIIKRFSIINFQDKIATIFNPTDPKDFGISLTVIPALILMGAFELGQARFRTLSRSAPMCFAFEGGTITGRLIARNSSGYFIYISNSNLRFDWSRLETFDEIAFVGQEALKGIFPSCDHLEKA